MPFVFKNFSEIDADYLASDLHMHSTWTDGEGSVEAIVEQAKSKGLKRVAITDHIRKTSTYFSEYYTQIRNLSNKFNFEILVGFEAKVDNFNGDIDVSEENLAKADISICSVHRFPIGRKLIAAKEFAAETSQIIELELSIAAIKKGGFNIMGHPGGMSLKSHGIFKPEYFEEIIIACKENNIAFDFNSSYHIDQKETLIALFKKHDPKISIGSDAHKLKDIGSGSNLLI
jgi:putative hydrolase